MSFSLLTNIGNKYIDRLLKYSEKKNGMKKNETGNYWEEEVFSEMQMLMLWRTKQLKKKYF